MNNFTSSYARNDLALLDKLLSYKMTSTEFRNNKTVIEEIGKIVDDIKIMNNGYKLITIDSGYETKVLIVDRHKGDKGYNIYSYGKRNEIAKSLSIKVHESQKGSLDALISKYRGYGLGDNELVGAAITESLSGFVINTKKITDLAEFMTEKAIKDTNASRDAIVSGDDKDIMLLQEEIKKIVSESGKDIRNTIENYVKRLKCPDLKVQLSMDDKILDKNIHVAKIHEVRRAGNCRFFRIHYVGIFRIHYDGNRESSNIVQGSIIGFSNAGSSSGSHSMRKLNDIHIAESKDWSATKRLNEDMLRRLPFNWIDEGRYIVCLNRSQGTTWDYIVSGDPKVDKDYVKTLKETIERYSNFRAKQSINLSGTTVSDGTQIYNYDQYARNIATDEDDDQLRVIFKTLKKMTDEFKYISKKHKAIGKDVNVTDKVKYNHKEGKVSYGDFSIAVNDEMAKKELYDLFDRYLLKYYRSELTEEQILESALDKVFKILKDRINYYTKSELKLKIRINEAIDVNIEARLTKNKSKMFYINGQRFNRNEVAVIVREITCYRDQKTADMFIRNVGKLGLSVYIGITSGYELRPCGSSSPRLYRFKKEKGRSKYKLLLDDIEMDIVGKRIISDLYKNFIGESYIDKAKLDRLVFDSTPHTMDYIKYKFLVDTAYEAFKKRSEEFLDQKIRDMDGTKVKYLAKNNYKNAIKITGTSGNDYIIAYDKKDSYVFMNADLEQETKDDMPVYQGGKYICMIDQSAIKSNIGSDTVIAKLMALKNDSVIASKIYNLAEELENELSNGEVEDDREEVQN